jgi:predicted transposase/invertase (TIGR01784 family)
MKESAMYQEILQEGRQEGRQEGEQLGLQKGKLEIARKLFQKGMNLEEIINLTGLSEQLLQQELSQS